MPTSAELESRNMIELRTLLLRLTCRLIRLDTYYRIIGLASGFIAERASSAFLFSAGHALQKGNWCLETDVSFLDTNETLLIPLNDVLWFKTVDLTTWDEANLEFAFARFHTDRLRQEAVKISDRLRGRPIEFTVYRGPLDEEPALGDKEYSYASWHSKKTMSYAQIAPSKHRLDRQAAGEFGMSYQGRTDDGTLYRFALADTHKGDDYYKGASGSPIVDCTGKVVSLLIGKDRLLADTLTGLPIKDYLPLLDADLDCLR